MLQDAAIPTLRWMCKFAEKCMALVSETEWHFVAPCTYVYVRKTIMFKNHTKQTTKKKSVKYS